MKITRREFGLAMLMGLGALLVSRFIGRFLRWRNTGQGHAQARFWSRADGLAG